MKKKTRPPLLTNEVAKQADASPDAVRIWARKGFLPATTTKGGVRLFNPDDVEKFLLERRGGKS